MESVYAATTTSLLIGQLGLALAAFVLISRCLVDRLEELGLIDRKTTT